MGKEIKLNQTELNALSLVPENIREQVRVQMLTSKQSKAASVEKARTEFAIAISEVVKQLNGSTLPGKGGFKITGLGSRFPITLYPEQVDILAAKMPEIVAYVAANRTRSLELRKAYETWESSQPKRSVAKVG